MTINYRPDIDGLRAVAVGSVLLYHAHLLGVSGGYVGVDVFFVISGFLITSILMNDYSSQRFSIARFYERRIRRIFPALIFVLLATSAASIVLLLPSELENFGKSLAATSLFASNINFWQLSNYFDGPGIEKPLLHTWSLAVEEQFYLVWPFVLYLLLRFVDRKFWSYIIFTLMALSLGLAEWLTIKSPKTSFYMLPPRAWELALGATLALRMVPTLTNQFARESAAIAGLAAIVFSIFFYTPETRFPGFSAILPCLGTWLIIWSGDGPLTTVGKLLSTRPFLFVGLLSYSLYLWHWPILALYQHNWDPEPSWQVSSLLLLLSVVGAYISWRFVEKPFRKSASLDGNVAAPIVAGSLAMLITGGVGAYLWQTNGLPERLPPEARWADQQALDPTHDMPGCFLSGKVVGSSEFRQCILRESDDSLAPANALLWGDSHASHYATRLYELGKQHSRSFRLASMTGCAPLADATQHDPLGDPDRACAQFNREVMQFLESTEQIKLVVISGRWARLGGEKRGIAGFRYLTDESSDVLSPEASKAVFSLAVDRMISRIQAKGIRVVILGPNPEFLESAPRCVARAIWREEDPVRCDRARDEAMAEVSWAELALSRLTAKHPDVTYISTIDALCGDATCPVSESGKAIYYFDNHHLRNEGAEKVLTRPGFVEQLMK